MRRASQWGDPAAECRLRNRSIHLERSGPMARATRATPPVPATRPAAERRWLALAVVLGGTFMAVFDNFVVNVAIPTIQRDLHASFAQVQFVIAGYALAYAVTLVTGGRLGDIYGRKRLFLLGLTGFTAASALCGLAPGPGVLIGARLLQGLAAAALTPQVLAIIQVTFPPQERARAFGLFGAVVGLAAAAGQGLGGLLVQADLLGLSWRAAFLVNVPVGVGILLAARGLLAESRSATATGLDPGGVAILSTGLFLLAFPLVAGREAGWPWWAWACLLAAPPALGGFVAFERARTARGDTPLVVLRLFRARAFVAGLLVSLLFNAASAGFFLGLALYLQLGLRFSPLEAGLVQLPAAAGFTLAATLVARLDPRLGSRLVLAGLALNVATFAAGVLVIRASPEALPRLGFAALIFGQAFGAGTASPRLTGVVLAEIGRDDAGGAAGVLATAQQIGGALGVALIGVVLFGVLAGHAPAVSGALAPDLAEQLARTPAGGGAAATVAGFRACADDRARSNEPGDVPDSCRALAAGAADPAVGDPLAAALQRANARNYANAYAVGMLAATGLLLAAIASALCLPRPRRST
jgi:EmrB/QacA subfamily drug resistance transporter